METIPPTDAINQMHRYRDAIYYSKEHEPFRSKEIIGGYILFPGRGEDENILRRYYSAQRGECEHWCILSVAKR